MAGRLTRTDVARAIAAGATVELRDAGAKGLILRVWGKDKWAWALRRQLHGRMYRLDLGTVWSLDEARGIAAAADGIIRSGQIPFDVSDDGKRSEPPRWYQDKLRAKLGQTPLSKETPRAPKETPKPQSMRWEDAVEEYLAEVSRTRRSSTVVAYRSCLSIGEMQRFRGRMVRDITRQEIAEVVREIYARAERQAETTVVAVRRLYSYLGSDDMNGRTGVEDGRMVGLKARERTSSETTPKSGSQHVPEGREIGSIMLALRDRASDIPERDRLALELLVYSAQRRRMVASARCDDFEFLPDGSAIWSIPPIHRKTAAMIQRTTGQDVGEHRIPLPPSAGVVVRRARNLAGGRKHLFPAVRDRREGVRSMHMSGETLTHTLADMGCILSPHDIRRALATTYLVGVRKLTKSKANPLAKEILDHSEGNAADVTNTHYLLDSDLHRKWETMRGWVAWVDKVYREEVARKLYEELADLE